MKAIGKILFCFLFSSVFLISCNQNQKNNPVGISPINQILKMRPVKITVARWIDYVKETKLKMETEEEAIKAFNNPENWIVYFETADINEIKMIMIALAKPPVEPYRAYMLPIGDKICFEDKNGRIKWTSLYISGEEKKIYLSDIIYGEETYNVFAKILNVKPIQETNPSSPKLRRTGQPEQKLSE